eukprot:m.231011 g.231011  ORF g.231011 m.231011 type:complete len:50 (-) comp19264_c0_seq1:4-153(-)
MDGGDQSEATRRPWMVSDNKSLLRCGFGTGGTTIPVFNPAYIACTASHI